MKIWAEIGNAAQYEMSVNGLFILSGRKHSHSIEYALLPTWPVRAVGSFLKNTKHCREQRRDREHEDAQCVI